MNPPVTSIHDEVRMELEEVLTGLGIPFKRAGEHHHVSEGWLGVDCGSCSPNSGRFRLGINKRSFAASCWTCGHVRLSEALAEAGGVPVGRVAGMVRGADKGPPTNTTRKVRGKLTLPENTHELGRVHREYLRSREPYPLDPDELVRLWGLRATSQVSDVPWHVVIPITFRGEVVSWTARCIGETKHRYHNAKPTQESRSAKDCLYGWDHVRSAVIVHEGPGDVWRTGPGSVALMGLKWSPAQILLLSSVPKRIICLDSTEQAQRRADQLADELAAFGGETWVVGLESKDAGCARREETAYLRTFLE